MLAADIAKAVEIVAVLVLLFASGMLLWVRLKSRASLVTDVLLRSSLPLAAIGLLGIFAVNTATMTTAQLYAWLAMQVLLLLVGMFVFVLPAFFMFRTLHHLDGFVIISRGLLEGMHKRLDSMYGPGPARLITYAVGKEAGQADAASAVQEGLLKGDSLWRWLPYIFRLAGYGRLRYVTIDAPREVRVTLDDSFEVFEVPDADGHTHNGCDLTRGYLAGIGKSLHPTLDCHVEETRCAQMHGGSRCEFAIKWFEPVKASEG